MKKLDLVIGDDLYKEIQEMADELDTTPADIVRRGLEVMVAFKEQKQAGHVHMGFVENVKNLDTVLYGVLD